MKVLSIRQPWAWLIVNGFKDVENRDWETIVRGPVLIHAGKQVTTWTPEDQALLDSLSITLPCSIKDLPRGGIVGQATIVDCVTSSSSPWFRGSYGLTLQDAKPFAFHPCKGALGFFKAPATFNPDQMPFGM